MVGRSSIFVSNGKEHWSVLLVHYNGAKQMDLHAQIAGLIQAKR
jgi:hypothetical protein